jgi:hypothetical protein
MSDINQSAQIEPKITAADLKRGCPQALQDWGKHIAAHYEKARKYEEKADEHYRSMAHYLAQAQAACDDGGFAAFRKRFCPNLSKTRAYQLLEIANGKKTIEDIRAGTRERVAKHRAKRASDSVTVTEPHDHVAEPEEICGDSVTVTEYHQVVEPRDIPSDSVTVTECPDHVTDAEEIPEIEDQAEPGSLDQKEAPDPEKPRRAHTPRDQLLFDFSAHVLEVLRRVNKHKPERFAKTSIPVDDLARLGKFLTDLAQLKNSRAKPTLVAGAVGNATISPEQSAEDMKAQHKAFEEPDDMAA